MKLLTLLFSLILFSCAGHRYDPQPAETEVIIRPAPGYYYHEYQYSPYSPYPRGSRYAPLPPRHPEPPVYAPRPSEAPGRLYTPLPRKCPSGPHPIMRGC